jgi:hypothetical protein
MKFVAEEDKAIVARVEIYAGEVQFCLGDYVLCRVSSKGKVRLNLNAFTAYGLQRGEDIG